MPILPKPSIHVLVFKTNIDRDYDVAIIARALEKERRIVCWSVDTEDVDKVLRLEVAGLSSDTVIRLVTRAGYHCEDLPD